MTQMLIENARLIDPETGLDETGAIRIEDGRIAAVEPSLSPQAGDEVVDAQGKALCPALIDLRVNAHAPGRNGPETLMTTLNAAAAGGVGTVVLSPTSGETITRPEQLEWLDYQSLSAPVRVMGAGYALDGEQGLTEVGLMLRAGAAYVGDCGTAIVDTRLARRVLAYASSFDALVSLRPDDPFLARDTLADECDMASRMGLPQRPSVGERIGVQRDTALAELTGARVLMDRITTREGLEALKTAKGKGLDVFASAPLTHLLFNMVDVGGFDPHYRLEPPLRDEADREALIEAVKSGLIDVVVSDHTPMAPFAKDHPFGEAEPGSANLEALLPALCTLVEQGYMSLAEALRPVTSCPAAMIGLDQGRLKVGAPADLLLFDPEAPVVYGRERLISQGPSAFNARRLSGKPIATLIEGALVAGSL